MKAFLALLMVGISTLSLFSAAAVLQDPCHTSPCKCKAHTWFGGNSSTGPWGERVMGNKNGFNGTIKATFNPQKNADGTDVSLIDGTCAKQTGCECSADKCGFNFSITFEIVNWGTYQVPPGAGLQWGYRDPGTGELHGGPFRKDNSGQWISEITTEAFHPSLACGTNDQPVLIGVAQKNPPLQLAEVEIHFACADCPNLAPQ